MSFPEHDWCLLRSSHPAALGRYCARVLEECAAVMQDADASAHDRYLRLCRLFKERDEGIVAAFDDLRRSTAIQRLAAMINLGVMTDVELAQFSRATRESAIALAEILGPSEKGRKAR